MRDPRPQRSSRPTSLGAVRWVLVATALTSMVAAGCGRDQHSAVTESAIPNASTRDSIAPPPAETAPTADSSTLPTGSRPVPPVPAVSTPTPFELGSALGAQVFAKRCALCHGPGGHGDGLASKGLNPKPRNFHDDAYMSTRSDAQLLEVIRKGKGVMPRWEGQLSEAEIQAVLRYVRWVSGKP